MVKNESEKTLIYLKNLSDNNINVRDLDLHINGQHQEEGADENDYHYNHKITGLDLSGIDFGKIGLEYLEFYNCDFTQCKFNKAYLEDCDFINCNFTLATFNNSALLTIGFANCDLDCAKFRECRMEYIRSTNLLDTKLYNTNIKYFNKIDNINDLDDDETDEENYNNPIEQVFYTLSRVAFLDCDRFENIEVINKEELKADNKVDNLNLSDMVFDFSTFENITFRSVDFNKSSFDNSKFINCTFTRCNFNKTNLDNTIINQCTFEDCNLKFGNVKNLSVIDTTANTEMTCFPQLEQKIDIEKNIKIL